MTLPSQDIVERLRSDASGIDGLADDGNFPAHFLERARIYSENAATGADAIERQARNIEMWKGQVARQSDTLSALRADNEALRSALEAERAAMDVTQRRAIAAEARADALAQEVEGFQEASPLIQTALEHASFALEGIVALDDEDMGKDGGSATAQHTKRTVDRALKVLRALEGSRSDG